ncbi:unnamed protein product [Heligmosomoides polygyrus]|uniref:RRM domain-containing protein n=1 Tax=Heligmosomoides polygyrus TaxID=6339 RepID=A0A183G0C9_HELPZ|nr:unnamed protein product [Heligmosomoides polygyrus]
MHSLLFLEVLLDQVPDSSANPRETGGVYGINGATPSDEAALIIGKLDNVMNSSIDNSLEDLHVVRKPTNWTGLFCFVHGDLLNKAVDKLQEWVDEETPLEIISERSRLRFNTFLRSEDGRQHR